MSSLVLSQVLVDAEVYRLPRIIAYNRLEARPRTTDFTRSRTNNPVERQIGLLKAAFERE